jgi:hypothetical protein
MRYAVEDELGCSRQFVDMAIVFSETSTILSPVLSSVGKKRDMLSLNGLDWAIP